MRVYVPEREREREADRQTDRQRLSLKCIHHPIGLGVYSPNHPKNNNNNSKKDNNKQFKPEQKWSTRQVMSNDTGI